MWSHNMSMQGMWKIMKTLRKQLHTREIEEVYRYNPSVNISKQLIHIFRARNVVKGEYEHDRDSVEDIRKVEIVSVQELKRMIMAGFLVKTNI
jgi:hypothetical protein